MNFEPRHVVSMVASVCAAAVLAPVGVMAATGTLTNLVDPFDSTRKARVTGISGLYVDTRPRATAGAFHRLFTDVLDVSPRTVKETSSPYGIAVTSIVFTVKGDTSTSTNHIQLLSRIRTSGTAACADATGWTTPQILVTFSVHAGSTEQLEFNGPPLVIPAPPAGQAVCLAVQQSKWTGSTSTDVAVTGFTFK
jgi:hypothetical protein